jgi:hypothetical protein
VSDDEEIGYPLQWPSDRPRTSNRTASRFGGSVARWSIGGARDFLLAELRRLGGKKPVISSNLRLRNDGLLRADQGEPADPGVAVYFEREGQRVAFSCDRWNRVADNLYSIAKTIEALRGIARWGTGDMVRAAFRGFRALPSPVRPWRVVFGVAADESVDLAEIERRYREAAAVNHPDRGGLSSVMGELSAARDDARRELSGG